MGTDLDQARRLQAKGDLNGALEACARALDADSHDAEAIELTYRVLIDGGQPVGAETFLQTAISQGIETPSTLPHLAWAALADGDAALYADRLSRAHAADPSNIQVATDLALMHLDAGRTLAGIAVMDALGATAPQDPGTALFVATFLAEHGQRQAALPHLDRFARQASPGPERDHRVAAVRGAPPPDRPDPSYIANLFDSFSDTYDVNLSKIDNRGPEVLERLLAQHAKPMAGQVLDAGCGTGLCAPLLRPRAQHLVGLDLSQGMLDKAAQTQAYDTLLQADLLALPPDLGAFDLIICLDVLTYLGDLRPAFASLAQVLAPGGQLYAAVTAASPKAEDIVLEASGRYRHRLDYALRAAAAAGLHPMAQPQTEAIRSEYGRPVDAHFILLGPAKAP